MTWGKVLSSSILLRRLTFFRINRMLSRIFSKGTTIMLTLLLTGWLCAPIAPLNPLEQDTLSTSNLHVAVAMTGPNGVVTAGPEFSARYEMLMLHPIVIRAGGEYKYGETYSTLYPRGRLHSATISLEALYYRGTKELLGYLGGGPVYSFNRFQAFSATADSLRLEEQVVDTDIGHSFGYRLVLGLRYLKRFALEVRITELYPDFTKSRRISQDVQSNRTFSAKTGSIALSFGYILPIGNRPSK